MCQSHSKCCTSSSHVIPTTTLRGRCSYHSHTTDEETEAHRDAAAGDVNYSQIDSRPAFQSQCQTALVVWGDQGLEELGRGEG